jgi:hypothetical protein
MLRDDILNSLTEILDSLEDTCSGLRDPNRVRVSKGWDIYKHLALTLPPDPKKEKLETPKVEPEPEPEPEPALKPARKLANKKKET